MTAPGKQGFEQHDGVSALYSRRFLVLSSIVCFSLSILLFTISIWIPSKPEWSATIGLIVKAAGASLITAGLGTSLLRVLIPSQDTVVDFLKLEVLKDLREQRQVIHTQIENQRVLSEAGVRRVYSSRATAAGDLLAAVSDPIVDQISIMGVSLTDFFENTGPFNQCWEAIKNRLIHVSDRRPPLRVRLLLTDPGGTGARLRSFNEQGHGPGRLADDVTNSLTYVVNELPGTIDGNIEARVYRLMPHSFVAATNLHAFIQPYYFWDQQNYGRHAPLLKIDTDSSLFSEIRGHFDLIWTDASCSAREFLDAHLVGIDQAARDTGMINMFSPGSHAGRSRERYLIDAASTAASETGGEFRLQAISLHRFFRYHEDGFLELIERLAKGRPMKVLLLDPYCRQAYFRSYLEARSSMTFPQYCATTSLHASSRLVRDIEHVVGKIGDLNREGARSLQVKYSEDAGFYLLLTDDTALVQQFHYGSLPKLNQMPLVEFARLDSDGSTLRSGPLVSDPSPYQLYSNHFAEAWAHGRDPGASFSVGEQRFSETWT